MANTKIEQFLAACPMPEEGCFAGDPDAFALMTSPDDVDLEAAVIKADIERAAEAAMGAGTEALPLEDATYTTATLDVEEDATQVTVFDEPIEVAEAAIGSGDERGVLEPGDERQLDNLRWRIARCAYACGRNAVHCPVFEQLT